MTGISITLSAEEKARKERAQTQKQWVAEEKRFLDAIGSFSQKHGKTRRELLVNYLFSLSLRADISSNQRHELVDHTNRLLRNC